MLHSGEAKLKELGMTEVQMRENIVRRDARTQARDCTAKAKEGALWWLDALPWHYSAGGYIRRHDRCGVNDRTSKDSRLEVAPL